jgi:hypothetical protein
MHVVPTHVFTHLVTLFLLAELSNPVPHVVKSTMQYASTGPWRVIAILKGAYYDLEHCDNNKRKEKKHASNLSPYPTELIPFQHGTGRSVAANSNITILLILAAML